jgi:hypothetical protein
MEAWNKDTGHSLRQGEPGTSGWPRAGLKRPYIYIRKQSCDIFWDERITIFGTKPSCDVIENKGTM